MRNVVIIGACVEGASLDFNEMGMRALAANLRTAGYNFGVSYGKSGRYLEDILLVFPFGSRQELALEERRFFFTLLQNFNQEYCIHIDNSRQA